MSGLVALVLLEKLHFIHTIKFDKLQKIGKIISPGFPLFIGHQHLELCLGVGFGFDVGNQFFDAFLCEDCLLTHMLFEEVVSNDVGLLLEVVQDFAHLIPHPLVQSFLLVFLELFGLDFRLHPLLILEHFLVTFVVLPGLLEFAVLFGVDREQEHLGQDVCPFFDFLQRRVFLILDFKLVILFKIELYFIEPLMLPTLSRLYSKKSFIFGMFDLISSMFSLCWSGINARYYPISSSHLSLL